MSKTRPSSSSMGATPPQRRAERVEHSQQHVRRGAEQPRGGARNAWGRKGERDGGRRSRGDEEENFFKSRPGSQKSRFSLPLQPESNCTCQLLLLVTRCVTGILTMTLIRIQQMTTTKSCGCCSRKSSYYPLLLKLFHFSLLLAYVPSTARFFEHRAGTIPA
jgi:hypothetical protein